MQATILLDPALVHRSSVGFERLFEIMQVSVSKPVDGGPPFDTKRVGGKSYEIAFALAGYAFCDLSVETDANLLRVTGPGDDDTRPGRFIHKGIRRRPFVREFQIANFVEVRGATLNAGILTIFLSREVPIAMQARRIDICADDNRL